MSIYIYTYLHIYVYMYRHIYMYPHIHIHIYVHSCIHRLSRTPFTTEMIACPQVCCSSVCYNVLQCVLHCVAVREDIQVKRKKRLDVAAARRHSPRHSFRFLRVPDRRVGGCVCVCVFVCVYLCMCVLCIPRTRGMMHTRVNVCIRERVCT